MQQQVGGGHTTSQHYRQLQQQLAVLNQKRQHQGDGMNSDYSQKSKIDHLAQQQDGAILNQQYSGHFQGNI